MAWKGLRRQNAEPLLPVHSPLFWLSKPGEQTADFHVGITGVAVVAATLQSLPEKEFVSFPGIT